MQRHLSISKLRGRELCLPIWALTFVAAHVPAALAQWEPPSPWTNERANALVFIKVLVANESPSVATGFIVDGFGDDQQYVVTSTHGLLPEATEEQVRALDPDDCTSLPNDPKLFQGNRGGPELRPDCAFHIGDDVSLVKLPPGTSRLPALRFLPCNLVAGDDMYLGGFPLGGDRDTTLVGQVRGNGPPPMMLGNFMTAAGLSGGPYLTADGDVVAVHRGGARYTAGYAHMVPVWAVRTKLEALLPQMKSMDDCPKPATMEQVVGNKLIALDRALANLAKYLGLPPSIEVKSSEPNFDMRVQQIETTIKELRKRIEWDMTVDKRYGVGVIVNIWYHRLVSGSETPPERVELRVKPV